MFSFSFFYYAHKIYIYRVYVPCSSKSWMNSGNYIVYINVHALYIENKKSGKYTPLFISRKFLSRETSSYLSFHIYAK